MTFALFLAPLLVTAPLASPAAAAPGDPGSSAPSAEAAPPAEAAHPVPSASPSPSPSARTASNVLFGEALGSGLLYSINYERLVDSYNLGLRGGVSYFSHAVSSYGASGNLKLLTMPFVVSYYLGTPQHKLQLGLGATVIYLAASTDSQGTSFGGERSGFGVAASAVVGYRYFPRDGGLSFGAGFTPLLRTSKFLPWGGADIGYVF
jgi:hypothetical protein